MFYRKYKEWKTRKQEEKRLQEERERLETEAALKLELLKSKLEMIAMISSLVLFLFLGILFFNNPDFEKWVIDNQYKIIVVPILVYFVVLLYVELIRSLLSIFFLGMVGILFGPITIIVLGVVITIFSSLIATILEGIFNLILGIISDIISGLFD